MPGWCRGASLRREQTQQRGHVRQLSQGAAPMPRIMAAEISRASSCQPWDNGKLALSFLQMGDLQGVPPPVWDTTGVQ